MEDVIFYADQERAKSFVVNLFSVCTTLSIDAIKALAKRIRKDKIFVLPKNYIRGQLLPALLNAGIVYESSPRFYTIVGRVEAKKKHGLDAFWVFLNHIDGAELLSIMSGPRPASMTFIRKNRIYHIIRCTDNGAIELGLASQLEIQTNQRRNPNASPVVDERYFIIFDDMAAIKNAPFRLSAPTMFVMLDYSNGKAPKLKYVTNINHK